MLNFWNMYNKMYMDYNCNHNNMFVIPMPFKQFNWYNTGYIPMNFTTPSSYPTTFPMYPMFNFFPMGAAGGSSVTYALGENGDAIELDDETKKKIQEIFDKYIKNAKLSTQALGEEGGGPIKIEGKTKEEIQKMFDEYIKEHRLTTIATSEEGGSDILDPKNGLL